VFADHGQIDFEGKPYHSSDICNEIDSHHGTTSDSEAVDNSSDSLDGNSSANPGTNDPDGNSSTNDDFDGDPDDPDDDHDSSTDGGSGDNDNLGNNDDHINANTNADNEEHSRILTGSEVRQSQQELWLDPTIVHYPGNRAGEVCLEGITVMQEYENALGGPSAENPYSPFSSKIDWELAKWAKLRGPSATSFTELLNISGVSVINKPRSKLHCLTIVI